MRRISEDRRRWQTRHALYSELSRLKRKGRHVTSLRSKARRRLVSPAALDLFGNYSATIGFIEEIRELVLTRKQRIFINMQPCSHLSPEAAVVLAAELQRCRDFSSGSINGMDPIYPKPRQLLRDLGFHALLGFNAAMDEEPSEDAIRYIAMRSGKDGDPSLFAELEELVFGEHVSVDTAVSNDLLAGLHEATLNVLHHAYKPDFKLRFPASPGHRWWSAGYRNSTDREIVFIFYDQGAGIPTTLGLKTAEFIMWGLNYVLALIKTDDDSTDGDLIKAAVELGRTSTAQGGRGYGLNDLRRLVDTAGSGKLTILSRRGSYVYAKGQERTSTLPRVFSGTLIIWRLSGSEKVKWS